MIITRILTTIVMISVLFISGCSGLLPTIKQTTKSPWQSFEEAKKAFDKIVPGETTTEELKLLGFDPFETPNVKLVTYLDIQKHFIPNESVKLQDLPKGVRHCLESQAACQGYEVTPTMRRKKRYGNVMLDLLNFRRKTVISGWGFDALIVLEKELVVYKLWGGEPNVLEYEDKKNPLGPLQEVGKIFTITN